MAWLPNYTKLATHLQDNSANLVSLRTLYQIFTKFSQILILGAVFSEYLCPLLTVLYLEYEKEFSNAGPWPLYISMFDSNLKGFADSFVDIPYKKWVSD